MQCGSSADSSSSTSALSSASKDPTFFPEIFPVETWTGTNPGLVIRTTSEDDFLDPAREQEALAALSAAQSNRRAGNMKRAKSIIEHALALAPNHPDILTEFGLFHEMMEDDVMEADLCYAKALAYDPHHSEALVRRKRTLPLVNAMDAKALRRIEAKRDEFARLPHTSSLKRAMRESYFLHIYHTVAIGGTLCRLDKRGRFWSLELL